MKKIVSLFLIIFTTILTSACNISGNNTTESETTQEIQQIGSEDIKNTLSGVDLPIYFEKGEAYNDPNLIGEKINYTVKTIPHSSEILEPWEDREDVIIYNNGKEMMTIKSTKLDRLIDDKLFLNEGNYRGSRLVIYDLNKKEAIYEKEAYRGVGIDEKTNKIRYSDILDIKPTDSKVICTGSYMYHQNYSVDYETFEEQKEGEIYCQYME